MVCLPYSLWSLWPRIGVCVFEGTRTASIFYRLLLAGKDLFLSGTWMGWLASRTAVEQGHGAASSFRVYPWLAGLLLGASTAVACAKSSGAWGYYGVPSWLAYYLERRSVCLLLVPWVYETTSGIMGEHLELVMGWLLGPKLGLQSVGLLLGSQMVWFLPASCWILLTLYFKFKGRQTQKESTIFFSYWKSCIFKWLMPEESL